MKMQIKITLRHHLVLDRMATARILMASTDRLQRKRNAYTLLVAVQSNTAITEISLEFLHQIQKRIVI